MNLLETEAFSTTFGAKSTRKRPKLPQNDYAALLKAAEEKQGVYQAPDHK
jgi:hypothetical protein